MRCVSFQCLNECVPSPFSFLNGMWLIAYDSEEAFMLTLHAVLVKEMTVVPQVFSKLIIGRKCLW